MQNSFYLKRTSGGTCKVNYSVNKTINENYQANDYVMSVTDQWPTNQLDYSYQVESSNQIFHTYQQIPPQVVNNSHTSVYETITPPPEGIQYYPNDHQQSGLQLESEICSCWSPHDMQTQFHGFHFPVNISDNYCGEQFSTFVKKGMNVNLFH